MNELRIVEPSVELITELPMLERIEKAGRICYRSEERIKEGSASKFVRMIVNKGHWSVLGHSQLYVEIPFEDWLCVEIELPFNLKGQFYTVYSKTSDVVLVGAGVDAWLELFTTVYHDMGYYFIQEFPDVFFKLLDHESFGEAYGKEQEDAVKPNFYTNSIIEMSLNDAMWMLKETMILTLDRASAMQLRTHRLATHSVMSQRYINFEKYGFPYIIPEEVMNKAGALLQWYDCKYDEIEKYSQWINLGFKPEIARTSLGSDIESTMAVTASLWEWKHIFEMRLDPHAQPAIQKVMKMAYDLLLDKYSGTELEKLLTIS